MIFASPERITKKIPEVKGEVCLNCLSELSGECELHAPKPITFEEGFAIAVEACVQGGLLKRESPNTVSFNFKQLKI